MPYLYMKCKDTVHALHAWMHLGAFLSPIL